MDRRPSGPLAWLTICTGLSERQLFRIAVGIVAGVAAYCYASANQLQTADAATLFAELIATA